MAETTVLDHLHYRFIQYISYCMGALLRTRITQSNKNADHEMFDLGAKLFPDVRALLYLADKHEEEFKAIQRVMNTEKLESSPTVDISLSAALHELGAILNGLDMSTDLQKDINRSIELHNKILILFTELKELHTNSGIKGEHDYRMVRHSLKTNAKKEP